MANEKIHEYTKIRTAASSQSQDRIDWDSTEDGGLTWESAQMTRDEFILLMTALVPNIYNSDGTLPQNRTVTSATFWTKFDGGDVIVEMDNELDDYAFIVNSVGAVEAARLGYDQATDSAILQLQNLGGVWFNANDGQISIGHDVPLSVLDIKTGTTGGEVSLWLDAVGGGTVGAINALNFYYNDSDGDRQLGNVNIQSRLESSDATSVSTSLTIGNAFKIDDTKRIYFGNSVLAENSGLAQFYIKGLNHVNVSTFLLDGNGTGTELAFHIRNSNGSASMMQVNCQSKVTFNVSKQATGDFNIKGDNLDNLFYTDASVDSVGIGTNLPNSSSILEVNSTTKGFRIAPMTSVQASAITPAEGLVVVVSDTNATFTSIGFWGYESGAWVKL